MTDEMDSVVKQGSMKKIKTNKLMYFVLHKDSMNLAARLEYYGSKKDWDKRVKPKDKRVIYLNLCFSVNAFSDSKVKFGLCLYTREDSLLIGFETESDRDSWLLAIIELIKMHRDARPLYPFVWDVRIREPQLGRNYEGDYRLCLTDESVIFVKEKSVDPTLTFPLEVIRRCGHTDKFFNLEVGRQACPGPGEFWMEVFDPVIAQSIHTAILVNMQKPKPDPNKPRKRRTRGQGSSTAGGTTTGGESIDHRPRSNSIISNKSQAVSEKFNGSRSATPAGEKQFGSVLSLASSLSKSEPIAIPPSTGADNQISASVQSIASTGERPGVDDYADMTLGGHNGNQSIEALASREAAQYTDSSYLSMTPGSLTTTPKPSIVSTESYMPMDMSRSSSISQGTSMNGKSSTAHVDSSYVDMKPGVSMELNFPQNRSSESKNPYIDMTGGGGGLSTSTSSVKDLGLRLTKFSGYEEGFIPTRHYSVGSRPPTIQGRKNNPFTEQYVEMCRSSDLADKEKSSSVPHLIPTQTSMTGGSPTLYVPTQTSAGTRPDYDRQRTASESKPNRPIVSSLTQLFRPRSASHDQKPRHTKKSHKNSSKESLQSTGSDYIDMQTGGKSHYVQMSPGALEHHHHHLLQHPKASIHKGGQAGVSNMNQKFKPAAKASKPSSINSSFDDVEHLSSHGAVGGEYVSMSVNDETSHPLGHAGIGRRLSHSQKLVEPFPELSASSEEELSMRSGASSFSSSKSASSSRSSLLRDDNHRSQSQRKHSFQFKPEGEPYVDCQQPTLRGSPYNSIGLGNSTSRLAKPERVTSYITEESGNPQEKESEQVHQSSSGGSRASSVSSGSRRSTMESKGKLGVNRPADTYTMMSTSPSSSSGIINRLERRSSKSSIASLNRSRSPNTTDLSINDSYAEMTPQSSLSTNSKASLPVSIAVNSSTDMIADSYVEMSPLSASQPASNPRPVEPSEVSVQIVDDPYMEMNPVSALPITIPRVVDKPAKETTNVTTAVPIIDSYMEMEPVQSQVPTSKTRQLPALIVNLPPPPVPSNELPKPPLPALVTSSPVVSSIVSKVDPYLEMEIPSNTAASTPASLGKPLATVQEAVPCMVSTGVQNQPTSPPALKPLPDIADAYVACDIDTISEASTAGSSELTQTTTAGTNSSDDSSQTVVIEEINLPPLQNNFNFGARYTMNRSPAVARKLPPAVCLLRQDSQDMGNLLQTPATAPCYIRNDSSMSLMSTYEPVAFSPTSHNTILDDLLNSAEASDCRLESDSYFNKTCKNTKRSDSMEVTAPLSPIKLLSKPNLNRSSDKINGDSDESDVPASAAQLAQDLKNKKQSEPTEDDKHEIPTSFIREDKSEKLPAVYKPHNKDANQPAPVKGKCFITDSEKFPLTVDVTDTVPRSKSTFETSSIKRNSSEPGFSSDIQYVELDHSQPQKSPKSEVPITPTPVSSGVVYTHIDPKTTEQLAKKNNSLNTRKNEDTTK